MTDVTNTNPDDEFSAAFAELNTPSTPTAAAEAPAPAAPAEASPSADAPAIPEGEAPAPVAAVPETPAAEVAPAPTPAPDDWKARFEALEREHEALKTRPAPAAEAPAPAPAAPAPIYNETENAALAKYREDWPDVAAGEALQRRAEYQQLVRYVFDQLNPQLEALQAATSRTTSRSQYQDIKDLVSDYDSVRQPTLNWIETQPEYLRNAYRAVAEEGSATDVADLINRFKKETGYAAGSGVGGGAGGAGGVPAGGVAPAASAPAAPAAAATPAAGLAPAAAAAVASLKVVKSSRSEPVSAPDMNDFDAAFAEFAKAG